MVLAERRYLVSEAAEILKVHQETVRIMIREGRLKAIKLGKTWQITESELERFLESLLAE